MAQKAVFSLPPYVQQPYEVFVNGVPQVEGRDFHVLGSSLAFERTFAPRPRLGLWRWLILAVTGLVVGGYHPHDTVDVVYTLNGRRGVLTLSAETAAAPSARGHSRALP